jgi:hypothetical protein
MKKEGQVALRGGGATIEMGWWRVGQKQAGGETKSGGAVELKRWARLGNGDTTEGASLLYLNRNATVIPTD